MGRRIDDVRWKQLHVCLDTAVLLVVMDEMPHYVTSILSSEWEFHTGNARGLPTPKP